MSSVMLMSDRFRGGHERRFSDVGACSHPSAESLIGRLDELDIRLRHLEEKQTLPEAYFAEDMRRKGQSQQGKSITTALQDVRLKGTLVDRIHLLETRIRQLSSELNNNGGSSVENSKAIQSVQKIDKNKKQKDLKEAIENMAKKKKKKRRMEQTRSYKRWFPVGC